MDKPDPKAFLAAMQAAVAALPKGKGERQPKTNKQKRELRRKVRADQPPVPQISAFAAALQKAGVAIQPQPATPSPTVQYWKPMRIISIIRARDCAACGRHFHLPEAQLFIEERLGKVLRSRPLEAGDRHLTAALPRGTKHLSGKPAEQCPQCIHKPAAARPSSLELARAATTGPVDPLTIARIKAQELSTAQRLQAARGVRYTELCRELARERRQLIPGQGYKPQAEVLLLSSSLRDSRLLAQGHIAELKARIGGHSS